MKNKGNIKEILQLAGTYISVCIGSGFATGQEIMQFFTAFGWLGVGTALVSMFLFSSLGAMLLHDGHTHQTNSDREIWVRYCGTKLGTVIDIFPQFLPLLYLW